jgi:hypothetical protein
VTTGAAEFQVTHAILWRRLDTPGHDLCALDETTPPRLRGAAAFEQESLPCLLAYEVTCDEDWSTTSARVSGWLGKDRVAIEIVRSGTTWSVNGAACPEVEGCLDVDLSFSPCTNLLHIRRVGLRPGEEAVVRAAWLLFPELRLESLEQTYRNIDDSTYAYESVEGGYRDRLRVNEAGFVTDYPGLWQAGCTI